MVHTYEVLVDIKEYAGQSDSAFHGMTTRYEVDAESRQGADGIARHLARHDHPKATELDARVTRLLK